LVLLQQRKQNINYHQNTFFSATLDAQKLKGHLIEIPEEDPEGKEFSSSPFIQSGEGKKLMWDFHLDF
jgi:hypothetical protein